MLCQPQVSQLNRDHLFTKELVPIPISKAPTLEPRISTYAGPQLIIRNTMYESILDKSYLSLLSLLSRIAVEHTWVEIDICSAPIYA